MRILVSVIDPQECAAFSRWPDYLDVKNPSEGSLGMPEPEVIRAVRDMAGEGAELSCAIGDADDNPEFYLKRAVTAVGAGADIVKVGLHSFSSIRAAGKFLERISAGLKSEGLEKKLVAAGYADIMDNRFLREFPEAARKAGAWGCLLDTFDKTRGGLLSHIEKTELRRFADACRQNMVVGALAGGLGMEDAGWLDEVSPDVVGFRSAVAKKGRGEMGLDSEKIAALFSTFAGF